MDLPDDAPAPRSCHVVQWADFDGYGFNLHAEKARTGQFIGKVDEDSPAELAGLRYGDRIVEVNGVNIANENHKQVVTRIKAVPKETTLLVVDSETDEWYKQKNIVVKSTMKHVIHLKTPVPRPGQEQPEPVQLNEEINTPPPQKQVEARQHVDEESGESVRKFDDEISNGNDEIETTTAVAPEEIIFEASSPSPYAVNEISDEQNNPPPPSSASNDLQEPGEKLTDQVEDVGKIDDNETGNEVNDNFTNEDDKTDNNNVSVETTDVLSSGQIDDEENKKNELDAEDGDGKNSHPIIEDELKTESPNVITPTSDRKSNQESPQSSRSSEHRETPPTTPTTPLPSTPEPSIERETEPEFKSTDSHPVNGRPNGQKPSADLNLNMSAQEMRQLLAQRKKKDVRKDQVDMRTKYMMVQKM